MLLVESDDPSILQYNSDDRHAITFNKLLPNITSAIETAVCQLGQAKPALLCSYSEWRNN